MKELKYKSHHKGVIYVGDHYKRKRLCEDEVRSLMSKYKGLYFRNIYDFDGPVVLPYWHIIQDRFFEIDELKSKSVRKNLRKSLSTYEYKLVNKETILDCGYQIFCDAAKRLKISPSWSLADFVSYVEEVYEDGGNFWIGYDIATSEPAMWESILVFNDHIVMDVERLSYRFTKGNPTYGLNYKIVEFYLKEKKMSYVDAGARSLTEHSGVQEFLVDKLQFRKAYCKVQCVISSRVKSILFIIYKLRWFFCCFSKFKPMIKLYQLSLLDENYTR